MFCDQVQNHGEVRRQRVTDLYPRVKSLFWHSVGGVCVARSNSPLVTLLMLKFRCTLQAHPK